ncbi:MAG: hypothetical protein ACRC7O_10715, partial [Fimbriiglobus sp.]
NSTKERDRVRTIGLAARGLFLETLSEIGKVADAVRVGARPAAAGKPVAAVFGLFRMSWPRPELLASATRRFCQRLLGRWAAKDAAQLKDPIARWLTEQWAKQKLDPGSVAARYDVAITAALGDTPDAVFRQAVASIHPAAGRIDATATCEVLDQLLRFVGKPGAETDPVGTLTAVVAAANTKLAADAEASLATFAVSFVEQPQYRLAGSEEALTQIAGLLQETIDELGDDRTRLAREAADAYQRLIQRVGNLAGHGGRRPAHPNELTDLMRTFPAARLRVIEADAALTLYRGLLGHVPEYLREVNFCRTRLGELGQTLAAPAGLATVPEPGAVILPNGCENLDSAADQFLTAVSPDDILEFDRGLQAEVMRRFRGVVNVCLKPDRAPDFLALLAAESRAFLDVRLEHADPAMIFLRHRGTGAGGAVAAAFEAAAPPITFAGDPPPELAVLAVPSGAAGAMVREVAADVCPGVGFVPAVMAEDLVFYREYPQVPLAELPAFGGDVRDAYVAQLGADFPPHARTDVPWPTATKPTGAG